MPTEPSRVSARAEVVTPGRDLVSGDFEDAHAGRVELLAVDDEAVDALREYDVAGSRQVHDLEIAPRHHVDEAFDLSSDCVVAVRRRVFETRHPRYVRREVAHD